jgi:hypothetical protein
MNVAHQFDDSLLVAIGAWQNGWREDQDRRVALGAELKRACIGLPIEFREVRTTCFRKRFIHRGEMVDLILNDEKVEGITSWTVDKAYAECFKGMIRPDAITAAIFAHDPIAEEVIVNLATLWRSPDFVRDAESFRERGHPYADALFNFRDRQGEVVLEVPLRASEIDALVGISSPFDELCDREGIPEAGRDDLFRKMLRSGVQIEEPRYTPPGGAQRALRRTIEGLYDNLASLNSGR